MKSEEWLTILDAKLLDDRNCSEDFSMVQGVVAVGVLEDLPCLESRVDCLMARFHTGLLRLVLDGVAQVVRALDLVYCTDIACLAQGSGGGQS